MKLARVDTPFACSWAAQQTTAAPASGIVDPRTVPVIFQLEQRRMNQVRRTEGTCTQSPAAATQAYAVEIAIFPR